jgi:hypothetical protein
VNETSCNAVKSVAASLVESVDEARAPGLADVVSE